MVNYYIFKSKCCFHKIQLIYFYYSNIVITFNVISMRGTRPLKACVVVLAGKNHLERLYGDYIKVGVEALNVREQLSLLMSSWHGIE